MFDSEIEELGRMIAEVGALSSSSQDNDQLLQQLKERQEKRKTATTEADASNAGTGGNYDGKVTEGQSAELANVV